jgi:uncharacterized membrane protein YgdD (TMEM256/DUF423 family)
METRRDVHVEAQDLVSARVPPRTRTVGGWQSGGTDVNPSTPNPVLIRISAAVAFLGVVLGAFGAHGLEARLEANGTLAIWETGVLYHLLHAVVMYVTAARPAAPTGAWGAFLLGIAVFSGSLYVLALTDIRWLGAITPIGGLAFLAGWAWLVWKPLSR